MARVKFGKGFDNFWTALTILVANKIVPSSAGFFYFDKKAADLAHADMQLSATKRPYVRGEANMLAFADAHPEWAQRAIDMATTLLESKPGSEPDDTPEPNTTED